MPLPSERTRLVINVGTVVALLLLGLWAYHDHNRLWEYVCLIAAAAQAVSMVWVLIETRGR